MGKFDGILICTDVDGTLLNSNNEVSQQNKKAIEYFKSNGGMFTFVTGRVPLTSKMIFDMINPNVPYGCINGGGVYDGVNEKYLWATVAPDCIIELADFVHNNIPEVCIQVNTKSNIYVSVDGTAMDYFYEITGIEKITKPYNEIDEPIIKIIFGDKNEDNINKVASLLANHPLSSEFAFVRSEKTLYEILPMGINKGTALKKLCEILNCDINKTIAIGDYDNDIGMLNQAKIGIAVSNATENAKNAADMITVSNDENAVAKIIYDLDNGILTFKS